MPLSIFHQSSEGIARNIQLNCVKVFKMRLVDKPIIVFFKLI